MDVWECEQLGLDFIRQTEPDLYFLLSPKISGGYRVICPIYHGSDYYNTYFSHRLDVLRFGLMTEKLRF